MDKVKELQDQVAITFDALIEHCINAKVRLKKELEKLQEKETEQIPKLKASVTNKRHGQVEALLRGIYCQRHNMKKLPKLSKGLEDELNVIEAEIKSKFFIDLVELALVCRNIADKFGKSGQGYKARAYAYQLLAQKKATFEELKSFSKSLYDANSCNTGTMNVYLRMSDNERKIVDIEMLINKLFSNYKKGNQLTLL